ncbi:MAG TPA: c-type cytochrome [Micropepsaceae bacterium]|nr:c-type cytochrome [Micropepsaceae bacterium]
MHHRLGKYIPHLLASVALLMLAGCVQQQLLTQTGETRQTPAGGHPLGTNPAADEYGEFLAREAELANVPTNDIVKSTRLNAGATVLGRIVYLNNCASCHGEDLRGIKAAHAPDLTDDDWRFSGDDLPSGGNNKLPSDVEWTVRYGVRSGNPNARGVEADMLAFDPQFRNQHDLEDYGRIKTVTAADIDDLAEYVLQLTGQPADSRKAAHGKDLFLDNAKGNCFDCHQEDATGNPALGSTNLTRKELFLYGSDKASIVESITRGRRGVMPEFGNRLKPEELKAVSVYVFSQAGTNAPN